MVAVARTITGHSGSQTRGARTARPLSSGEGIDGRALRGERTRRALAEALVSLLEEGDLAPTARAVAERAGVSPRIVFHHFDDMESVLRHTVAVQVERHWSTLSPIDPALSTEDKVARLVRQRSALFDAIEPVRRAAALVEHRSPTISAQLDRAQRTLRAGLAETFAPELEATGTGRTEMLDMLEVSAGWETWDQLRRRLGHGPAAARRVMTSLLHASMCSFPAPATDRRHVPID